MNLAVQSICLPSPAASCLPIETRSILSPSITTVAFGSTFPSQGLITVAPTSEILSARILAAATNESVRAMAALDFTIRDSSTRLGMTKDYSFDSGTAFSAALNPILEWVPSQNGFSVDAPQRQSAIRFSTENLFPSASLNSNLLC